MPASPPCSQDSAPKARLRSFDRAPYAWIFARKHVSMMHCSPPRDLSAERHTANPLPGDHTEDFTQSCGFRIGFEQHPGLAAQHSSPPFRRPEGGARGLPAFHPAWLANALEGHHRAAAGREDPGEDTPGRRVPVEAPQPLPAPAPYVSLVSGEPMDLSTQHGPAALCTTLAVLHPFFSRTLGHFQFQEMATHPKERVIQWGSAFRAMLRLSDKF